MDQEGQRHSRAERRGGCGFGGRKGCEHAWYRERHKGSRRRRHSSQNLVSMDELDRRKFVLGVAAAADERRDEMIYRTLGRTGEKLSALGLGGRPRPG